jgi:hypothetical protein
MEIEGHKLNPNESRSFSLLRSLVGIGLGTALLGKSKPSNRIVHDVFYFCGASLSTCCFLDEGKGQLDLILFGFWIGERGARKRG